MRLDVDICVYVNKVAVVLFCHNRCQDEEGSVDGDSRFERLEQLGLDHVLDENLSPLSVWHLIHDQVLQSFKIILEYLKALEMT